MEDNKLKYVYDDECTNWDFEHNKENPKNYSVEKSCVKEKIENDLSLKSTENDLIEKIDAEEDTEKFKDIVKIFNANLVKKNMIRALKQSELLDLITSQASERIKKRPDEITTKELIDYLNAFQTSVEKSQKSITSLENIPLIQINQNENKVNINMNSKNELSSESRERVLEVVKNILAMSNDKNENNNTSENIIEGEVIEEREE